MVHRFFVPTGSLDRGVAELDGALSHQIADVLRLRQGDSILLLDNSGWEYETTLTGMSPGRTVGTVRSKRLAATEPRVKITLYHGLIRAQSFEFVLQKCTEVGVVAFVPMVCERSSVGQLDEIGQEKWGRWQRIVTEAAEQSHRAKLPVLQPAAFFAYACENARGTSLLAYEDENDQGLCELLQHVGASAKLGSGSVAARPFAINLLIGPEGGFSKREVDMARGYGLHVFGLGPRILRSETAAIVAVSLVLYELGDLQPGNRQ